MVILLNKETTGSSFKEGAGKKYSILVPLKKIEYDSDDLGFSLIFNDPIQKNLHFRLQGNILKINAVDVTGLSIEAIIDKVRDEVFYKANSVIGTGGSMASITTKTDDAAAFAELTNGQGADFEVGGIIYRYSKNAAGTQFKNYNQYT